MQTKAGDSKDIPDMTREANGSSVGRPVKRDQADWKIAFAYCAALVIVLSLLLGELVRYYPIGDLVDWLHKYRFAFSTIFTEPTQRFHYHPLSLVWAGLPMSVAGFNVFLIRLNLLATHLANGCMVFLLARLLLRDNVRSFAAAVLFAAGVLVPPSILGDPPNVMMTFLLLSSFFLFRAYLSRRNLPFLVSSYVAFALSTFVFPTAINFGVVMFFYLVFDPEGLLRGGRRIQRSHAARLLRLLLPYVVITVVFLFIRSLFAEGLTYNSLNLFRPEVLKDFSRKILLSLDITLIPSYFIRAFLPAVLVATEQHYFVMSALAMLCLFGLALYRPSGLDFFLVSWTCANIAMVAFETDIRWGHLYLPSIPASILFVRAVSKGIRLALSGAGRLLEKKGTRFPLATKNGMVNALLIAALFVPVKNNIVNVRYRLETYRKASEIARTAVHRVLEMYPQPPVDKKIYLVNMPSHLYSPGGVACFVLPYAHLLYLLDLETGTPQWASSYRRVLCRELYVLPRTDWKIGEQEEESPLPEYSREQLCRLSPDKNIVLFFDYFSGLPVQLFPDTSPGHGRMPSEEGAASASASAGGNRVSREFSGR